MLNPDWCAECQARYEADQERSAITTAGGWCSPKPLNVSLWDACGIIQPQPRSAYIRLRNPRWWLHGWKMWREHQQEVGRMVHGYAPILDALPNIQAKRGGVRFDRLA